VIRILSSIVAAAFSFVAAGAPGKDSAIDCLATRRIETDAARIGERYPLSAQDRYRLTYRSEASFDLSALFDAGPRRPEEKSAPNLLAQSFRTVVTGVLESSVAEVSANRILVIFRIVDPVVTIEVDDSRDERLSTRVGAELASPVSVTMDASGHIREISTRRDSLAITQGLLRSALSLSQFVTPEGGRLSQAWTVSEDDPSGTFRVRYVPLSEPGAPTLRFRKERIAYVMPPAPPRGGRAMVVRKDITPSGSMEGSIDRATGALQRLEGIDRQKTMISGKQVGEAQSEFRLAWLTSRCMNAAEHSAMVEARKRTASEYLPPAPLFAETTTASERERLLARSALGADTLDTLLASLDRVATGAPDAPDSTKLHLKLKALVRLHPEASGAMVDHVARLDYHNPAYALVVGALRAVGDEAAQEGMLRMLTQAKEVDEKVALLVALATVAQPSAATVARFEQLAASDSREAIASTAQLGLGVFARKIHANDPKKSDAIVRMLVTHFHQATNIDARQHWLRALGNAGTPAAFGVIASQLKSPDPGLRSTAAMSLRWQENPGTEELLVAALRGDADEHVRASAAKAMSFRPSTTGSVAALGSALASDSSRRVRRAAVEALSQSYSANPDVRAMVRRAAEDDVDEGVRETARRIEGR